MNTEDKARRVFGERAAFYTTSAVHADPQVLARVVALADPKPGLVGPRHRDRHRSHSLRTGGPRPGRRRDGSHAGDAS